MRMRSNSVLRHASLKLTSANMRWKLSSVRPPLSAITERRSAWTIGMTIRSVRNAMVGRRSANGRNRSVRVRISSPLAFALRSLHLAGAGRSTVRAPALDVPVIHGLLDDRRLLVEHGLNGLVLHDDPHERVGDRLVELTALRAEADRQRNDLRFLRVRLLGDGVGLELQALIQIRWHRRVHDGEEAVLAQGDDLSFGLEAVVDQRLRAALVRRGLRDSEADHDAHVVAALGTGGRGDGHEVVRLGLEDVDEPREVVESEPDGTRLERP